MKPTGKPQSLLARDGTELVFYTYGPEDAERAVLVVHGIESHAGWFGESCQALAQAGLRVSCPDRRGSGSSGGPRGHTPSAQRLLEDLQSHIDWLEAERPGRRLQAVAHSWGAVYLLAFEHFRPGRFDRLALVSPGLFPLVDLTPGQKLKVSLLATFRPETTFPIPIGGPEAFTANPARQEAIAQDPLRLQHATARFFASAWLLRQRALRAARTTLTPMAVFLAGHDSIIDTSTTRRFFFACPEGTLIETFDDAHHTLEFEPEPKAFLDSLCRWASAPVPGELEP